MIFRTEADEMMMRIEAGFSGYAELAPFCLGGAWCGVFEAELLRETTKCN